MDKKTLFNNALTKLVEFAATKENKIAISDVKSFFDGIIDDDSQYHFIYDYLTTNKIIIEGISSPEDIKDVEEEKSFEEEFNNVSDTDYSIDSETEMSFVNMYMAEMDSIPPVSDEEKKRLVKDLLNGDTSVVNRIIESKLKDVAEIASTYRGKGVSFGDLIQEGNIGLMVAISDYNDNLGDFDEYINKCIINTIKSTINDEINSDRIGQHLADKLNQLDKATKTLSEKLGHVPEISELSKEMGLDEDEVSILLKTSLDTLSVNEDTHITDEEQPDGSEDITTPSSGSDPLQWRKHTRK